MKFRSPCRRSESNRHGAPPSPDFKTDTCFIYTVLNMVLGNSPQFHPISPRVAYTPFHLSVACINTGTYGLAFWDTEPIHSLCHHRIPGPADGVLAISVSQGKLLQCRNSVGFLGFRFLCISTTMYHLIFT